MLSTSWVCSSASPAAAAMKEVTGSKGYVESVARLLYTQFKCLRMCFDQD
jgi:hypothetical protein